MSSLQSFFLCSGVEILACTETWLTPTIFNNEVVPPDFRVYRKDRIVRGGGVLFAIKDHISCFLIPSPNHLELLTIVSRPFNHLPLTLCVVYCPPNASSEYKNDLIGYISRLSDSISRLIGI